MPIYDYVCSSCKHRVEVIHGIHAAGPQVCPSCGREGTMRRAFATPAIHFKGSGWAKKDRSSSSGTKTKASAGSSAAAGDSKTGGTGDAASTTSGDSPTTSPAASSSED